MGYTADAVTGKPVYNNVSTTQADLQAAADFALRGIGENLATAASLPANGGTVGRAIWIIDEETYYVWETGGWVNAKEIPATVLTVGSGLTLPAGVTQTAGRGTTKVWRERGVVYLEGCLTTTAAVGFGFLNLPVGYQPPGTVRIWCDQGGFAEITSAGVVSTSSSGARPAIGFSGHFHA